MDLLLRAVYVDIDHSVVTSPCARGDAKPRKIRQLTRSIVLEVRALHYRAALNVGTRREHLAKNVLVLCGAPLEHVPGPPYFDTDVNVELRPDLRGNGSPIEEIANFIQRSASVVIVSGIMHRTALHSAGFVVEEGAGELAYVGHEQFHLDHELRQVVDGNVDAAQVIFAPHVARLPLGGLVARGPMPELFSVDGYQGRAEYFFVELQIEFSPDDCLLRLRVQRRKHEIAPATQSNFGEARVRNASKIDVHNVALCKDDLLHCNIWVH